MCYYYDVMQECDIEIEAVEEAVHVIALLYSMREKIENALQIKAAEARSSGEPQIAMLQVKGGEKAQLFFSLLPDLEFNMVLLIQDYPVLVKFGDIDILFSEQLAGTSVPEGKRTIIHIEAIKTGEKTSIETERYRSSGREYSNLKKWLITQVGPIIFLPGKDYRGKTITNDDIHAEIAWLLVKDKRADHTVQRFLFDYANDAWNDDGPGALFDGGFHGSLAPGALRSYLQVRKQNWERKKAEEESSAPDWIIELNEAEELLTHSGNGIIKSNRRNTDLEKEPTLKNIKQLAADLQVNPRTLYHDCQTGKVNCSKWKGRRGTEYSFFPEQTQAAREYYRNKELRKQIIQDRWREQRTVKPDSRLASARRWVERQEADGLSLEDIREKVMLDLD